MGKVDASNLDHNVNEIHRYHPECWKPIMTLDSSSQMYKEVTSQGIEYQVTPGAQVDVTCEPEQQHRHDFSGYNLTLIRIETNEEQEHVVTSHSHSISVRWKATVVPTVYSCHVTWPGQHHRILTSKNVTLRYIDTDKEPSLYLNTSSFNNTASATASFTFWAHPSSLFTWSHPNGSKLETGICTDISSRREQCQYRELSLRIRKGFTVNDVGNYTLRLQTPYFATLSVTTSFSPKFPPQKTQLSVKGTTESYALLNTTITASCTAFGNPPPSLALDTCATGSNDTCVEVLEGVTAIRRTKVSKEWLVRVPSDTPVMNLTCEAASDEGRHSSSLQVYVSDATSLEEHRAIHTHYCIEGDNVTLPCHFSVAKAADHPPVAWINATRGKATKQIRSSSAYLQTVALSFSPVLVTDARNYTCMAGKKKVTVIDLQVKAMKKPTWVSDNRTPNTTHRLHHQETLTFTCEATGVPEPRYRWTKDGEEIKQKKVDEEREYKDDIDKEREGGEEREGGGDSHYLTILKGRVQDEGLYVCEVENRAGSLLVWYKVEFLRPHTSVPKHVSKLIVALAVAGVLVVALIGWCLYNQWRSYKYSLQAARAWKEGNVKALNTSLSLRDQAHLLPFKPKFEISRHQITFGKMLGCGAFGRVYRATVADLSSGETNVTVAVKMIRARSDKTQLLALQSELKILMHIGKHVNIVNLVATCTKNIHKKDLMLVFEYCCFGNILDYMRRHKSSFVNQLAENGEEFLPGVGQSSCESCSEVEENEGRDTKVYISADRVIFNPGKMKSTTTNAATITESTFGQSRQPLVVDGCQGQVSHASVANTCLGSDMTCLSLITDTHNLQEPSLPCDPESLSRPLCSRDLLCWGFQVARGMDFLAYRKVLHGDLAARNVLLTEGNLVKISDFGLAKDIYKYNNYKKDKNSPLPVKWMSVEALREGIFSTESDVWAYGVVLWEIFSLGRCPFPGVTMDESFIKSLENGYRMECPKYCTRELHQVMLDCWATAPENRPCFNTLQSRLSKMLSERDSKYYEDLQKIVEEKEALEAEEEEKDSSYLNMVGNVNYANLVQAKNQSQKETTEDDNAYIMISSVQEDSKMTVRYVINKGYVSLSNAENLMVGGGEGEAAQGFKSSVVPAE
ncbi:vascular endothelial growth factor receptor 1-like isoform X2 [Portunus trituberculatus]|uniref:vascular endothelial growth factor receptor 1-like isoform X2 n=1 Tax=Portunus trituberculatus TaxID=210409 RepID=UPI001E1D0F29|nr:vascular endothelial growth factor receptor 1-like isoform X2 [Portunus trituberculatus]